MSQDSKQVLNHITEYDEANIEESNPLIAQRKNLLFHDSRARNPIISKYRTSKQCVSYLIQELEKSLKNKNDIWISYGEILAEA